MIKNYFLLKNSWIVLLLLISSFAFGQKTWVGANNGNWNVASNWSPVGVPGGGDNIVFNTTRNVNIDIDPVINNLTISSLASVSFTSAGGARTISISNSGSSIARGSTLTLQGPAGSGTRSMNIVFTGVNRTMSIAGNLNLTNVGGGSSYNATNSITTVTGTIKNSDSSAGTTGTITSTDSNLSFEEGGVYQHDLNGGAIPTATWDIASNCNITGYVNADSGSSTLTPFMSSFRQTFGNFIWNSTKQISQFSFAGQLKSINGNMIITSTGSLTSSLAIGGTGLGDLTVGGNYNQINGNLIISLTGARTMFVSGDFKLSGGTFDMSSSLTAANYTALNVGGDFNFTGGTITESGSTTGSVINFNGTTTQMFTSGGTLSNIVNFTILSGATVDFGTSIISSSSSGKFSLNAGGTIITANTNATGALTLAGTNGTIQLTGSRTYNSGANYTFNGAAAQVTGLGLSQNSPRTVTINNSSGVNFSAATTMNNLVINSGSKANLGTFSHTASLLFLGGETYSSGVYGGASSTGPAVIINSTYFQTNTGYIILSNTVTQTFSATTDFIVPCGVNSAIVEVWGGGGRGRTLTSIGNGGGGGGGAYSKSTITTLIPGDTYKATVGGGSSTTAAGANSWFGKTVGASLVLAKGGNSSDSSNGAAGGDLNGAIGTTKFSGGSGATGSGSGTTGYSGGGGSSAGTSANGNLAINSNGAIAPAAGGYGGNGFAGSTGSGADGLIPGGGGGGAYRSGSGTSIGGSGADGQITITYTPDKPTVTLGSNPIVCQGIISSNISFTALLGCPDQFSIDYNATANTAGFVDVALSTLTGTSIPVAIPSNIAVGTYSGTLIVINSTTGSPSVGYAITIKVNSPKWTGGVSNVWGEAGNWCGGIPTATTDVMISSGTPFQPVIVADAFCKSLTISANASLSVELSSTLTITNNLTVDDLATVTFENNSTLVQINDGAVNTGNISYKRNTAAVKRYDFTYWSSPVVGQTLKNLSPNTLGDKYYSYSPSGGYKIEYNGDARMSAGNGYLIRAPQSFDIDIASIDKAPVFIGVPNNGVILTAKGAPINLSGNNFYLLGNPYPSALDADKFLKVNESVLQGTLYFWIHNSKPSNTIAGVGGAIYNYNSNDYASYNRSGSVNTIQASITGGTAPTGKIAAGQGFFALASALGGDLVINNSMRVGVGGITGSNNQFYRTKAISKTESPIEKNRVWLNLSNKEGAFKQTLVGYITGATNNYDESFDGFTFDGNEYLDFYSVAPDGNFVIQGRALPFDETDTVALGYRAKVAGNFNIAIDQTDGLLINQNVYLEDKLLNIVHDLKTASYNFSTIDGRVNDRFVLRYTNKTLGTENFSPLHNQLIVSKDRNELKIKSEIETIKRVTVYDLLGRKVFEKDALDSNEFRSSSVNLSKQIGVVKITLTNGQVVSKKVNF